MTATDDVWAVVPIKGGAGAKQRLGGLLAPAERTALAMAMAEDVLEALAAAPGLAGIVVVTLDPASAALARRYGARVVEAGAADGHTGAVLGARGVLLGEGRRGLLQVPGDIPRITADEVAAVLAAHRAGASGFTIVPAHDERGSNAVLLTPPDCVPLRFGDDSYFPHLAAARQAGQEPVIVPLPGIGMDIDHPADLARFLRMTPRIATRALLFLERSGLAEAALAAG